MWTPLLSPRRESAGGEGSRSPEAAACDCSQRRVNPAIMASKEGRLLFTVDSGPTSLKKYGESGVSTIAPRSAQEGRGGEGAPIIPPPRKVPETETIVTLNP
jgi:hypothetical protein